MLTEHDVTPDPSPAPVADPALAPEPVPVSDAVVAEPNEDRPLKNLQAEFNRKVGKVESKVDDLAALIQQHFQPKPPQAPTTQMAQYTDEQLVELYRSGSVEAGLALQQRIAQREAQAVSAQQQAQQVVQQQFHSLKQRYPQFSDTSDPLYQAALEARQTLIRSGYPAGLATDLEAMKYAVLDNPHLVTKTAPAAAADASRRAAASSQNQIDGAAPRRQAAPAVKPPVISEKAAAIAQRMGIKDPAKAMKRFEERQAAGRSSVSPMIAAVVKES